MSEVRVPYVVTEPLSEGGPFRVMFTAPADGVYRIGPDGGVVKIETDPRDTLAERIEAAIASHWVALHRMSEDERGALALHIARELAAPT